MKSISFTFYLLLGIVGNYYAQTFPNPATLSTGQGVPGNLDPLWLCSDWSATVPPNPMGLTFSQTLINNNCAPGNWIDPASLAPPMNNGNWITGMESDCANNTTSGYRYFRLPLNLPPDCNGNSVTVAGNYVLNLMGYVDNSIIDVFINGSSQGIAGGGFGPGNQLNISLNGPWVVGLNYIDILVLNAPNSDPSGSNPYGLLLVADGTSAANTDSDNDGISDLYDACPCDFGSNPLGCSDPVANTCDIALIRSTFINEGCIELPLCYSDCSMYFLNPDTHSGSSAQAYAQTLGANLISVESAAENECIMNELARIGQSGVIWIGFNDEPNEGTFEWYDGAPVTYTNWASGEPNSTNGNEDCTQIYADGMWNDLNCNTSNAQSIIEVNLCPVITTQDVIVCLNEPAVVTVSDPILGSQPYNFIWNSGETTQTQTVPGLSANHIVAVVDRYNCSTRDTLAVIAKPLPMALPTPVDTAICTGELVNIQIGSDLIGTTFTWTVQQIDATGGSSGTGNTIAQNLQVSTVFSGTANYTITPTLDGCVGPTSTAGVTINPLPILIVSPDAYICSEDSTTISVSGATTYLWDNGLGAGASHTVSPPTPTTYTVEGIDANGCSNVNSVDIGLFVSPIATITGSDSVCLNTAPPTLTLTGSQGLAPYMFTYTINGGPTQAIYSTQAGVATLNVPTNSAGNFTYQLISVSDANGCDVLIGQSASVLIFELPLIIAPDAFVCTNDSVILAATGGDQYTWYPSTYLNTTNSATPQFTAGVTTQYTVTGIDLNGCVNDTFMFVTVHPLPIIDAGGNYYGCIGDEVTLSATGAGLNGGYQWNVATVQNEIPFLANVGETTYTVVGTDANNCYASDSVLVDIQTPPIITFEAQQDGFCKPVTVTFTNTTPATQNCIWTMDNGTSFPGCGPSTQSFDESGIFGASLYTESTYGCGNQLHLDSLIVVDEDPIASFSYSNTNMTSTYPLVNFVNSSQNAVSYEWNFGDESPFSNEISPNHTFPLDEHGSYDVTLYAYSILGCVDSVTNSIQIVEDLLFYIPNTFTPDGNQFNQSFLPIFTSGFDPFDYTLLVFNRWGECVFESHDALVGWNGLYGGKDAQSGVYTWKVEFKTLVNDERKSFTGFVNLMK